MNYIIYHTDDLGPQIHTCCRHENPELSCAPECEACTEQRIAEHMQRLAAAGRAASKIWHEKGYREEYERLSEDLRSAGYDPGVGESETVLTAADLSLAHEKLYQANIAAELETARELLANCLAELERVEPLIAAAYAMEKEADYLHPYSQAVCDAVSRFRAAVLKYKKGVDADQAKP